MNISSMFQKDINRPINGVIQVEQEQIDVIKQEVSEYVVTAELKKHFNKFFESYSASFDTPTDNTGVWITGFFGSGKSHFLKMLSYLLENKDIDGKSTVEYFREKYDDELSFMNIEKSTQVPTETILFNIDVEGSMNKDATAVLKVFAKTFYDHLGFYGADLKVAKMEQFVSKQGKMDEFKTVFEQINGGTWIESRKEFAFWEDDIVDTLVEVLGMSEEAARNWFNGTETVDISIGQLVDEINDYVNTKPEGFRLLFMIDEAGQYVGTNGSLLLNLQSIIEKIGSVCRGQVWVVATGQEALDEIIKVRANEFSRIMARFSVRLSLTSSSVGEVIEKRLLTKTDEAYSNLKMVYENNSNALSNLYSIVAQKSDLKGYSSAEQFARVFPFVPYQFIIMQEVFNQVRKKGHAGKHHSSGERSMLNGFQESAQKIQQKDEFSVVPLHYFYDTLHGFLDTAIRSVIERAERAAQNGEGLVEFDVNLLKLLYLIRYIDDIPSNVENLTILMADDIRVDKKILREEIKKSLDHLINQNYISRNGDLYMFLTDEEQDIARDIRNTEVDTSTIVSSLGNLIFNDIYTSKKFKYNKNDFEFNQGIDDKTIGATYNDAMKLHFMTVAAEPTDLQELHLVTLSKSFEAICVLSEEYPYFESLETAQKIRKYIKQIKISEKPASIQKIIEEKQKEAARLEKEVVELIKKAIVKGKFYIGGEIVQIPGSEAVAKINKALELLVEHTYYHLDMIDENYSSDADIAEILSGSNVAMDGMKPNNEAIKNVKNYLEMRRDKNLPTSTYDLNDRYCKKPYGWKNIDIAGVLARMLVDGEINIKYAGNVILPDNPRMAGYLRNKSADGNIIVALKVKVQERKLKSAIEIIKEYFDIMDVPSEEDEAIPFILSKFEEKKSELDVYKEKNKTRHYPGLNKINEGLELLDEIFTNRRDNIALIDTINNLEDDLLDNKEDLKQVEEFYKSQYTLFTKADEIYLDASQNIDYYRDSSEAMEAIAQIKEIVEYKDNYNYSRIPLLNDAIADIVEVKLKLLKDKKDEITDFINQCFDAVETKSHEDSEKVANILNQARINFDNKKAEIEKIDDLEKLDSRKQFITRDKDNYLAMMEKALAPEVKTKDPKKQEKQVKENQSVFMTENSDTKVVHRDIVFESKYLKSEDEIDSYLKNIKAKLMKHMEGKEGIIIR